MTPLESEPSDSECRNCGTHVSADFRRTFGDSESVVYRCMGCDSRPRIQAGSAAGREVDYPDPAEQSARNSGSRVPATDGGVVGGEEP